MNKILSRYRNCILIAAIIFLLVFKLVSLNKINFDIDLLTKQLAPFKSYIHINSSVGFSADIENKSLYMPVAYVMAPQIILNSPAADTLLVIQNKTSKIAGPGQYRVIAQKQDGDRIMSLVTRIK